MSKPDFDRYLEIVNTHKGVPGNITGYDYDNVSVSYREMLQDVPLTDQLTAFENGLLTHDPLLADHIVSNIYQQWLTGQFSIELGSSITPEEIATLKKHGKIGIKDFYHWRMKFLSQQMQSVDDSKLSDAEFDFRQKRFEAWHKIGKYLLI